MCRFFNFNVNQGVIRAKSFQNTLCKWSGMLNLYVPKWLFIQKLNLRVEDHLKQRIEIMTVTVFGYLILISVDFYDFISPFSP